MIRKNHWIFIAVSVLLLYFMAQTATDAFLSFHGPDNGNGEWLYRAAMLNPLSAEPHLLLGFAYLERGQKEQNLELVGEAIVHLKKAIKRNPFVYQAHLNLGKAYFLLSQSDSLAVSDGILSFKRAAGIRGANLSVAMDSARLFFSLWPLLKSEDQEFARNLVLGIMHRISRKDFESLVELWSLYNRKIELMEQLISRRPEFSQLVADALTRNRRYNDQRRRLLNTRDFIRYQAVKRRVEGELNKGALAQDTKLLTGLFTELDTVYRGYDRLLGEDIFPESARLSVRRRLGERILSLLIDEAGKWRSDAGRKVVDSVVAELIADSREYENVFNLESFLEKVGYYREGDLNSFLARQRMLFQTSRYDQVIDQIETLQRQMSFIREDARPQMIEALFLLCESYRQSRLLTMAGKVLDNLEALSPDPKRLLWQRYQIEKVISVVADAELIESWRRQFAESLFLTLDAKKKRHLVYLDDNLTFSFQLSDDLWQKSLDGQINLIEIVCEGRVIWDGYIGEENLFTYTFPENSEGRTVEIELLVK